MFDLSQSFHDIRLDKLPRQRHSACVSSPAPELLAPRNVVFVLRATWCVADIFFSFLKSWRSIRDDNERMISAFMDWEETDDDLSWRQSMLKTLVMTLFFLTCYLLTCDIFLKLFNLFQPNLNNVKRAEYVEKQENKIHESHLFLTLNKLF